MGLTAPERATYRVTVAGKDISSKLHPYLISLSITDNEGTHSDTAEIVLDDSYGQLPLPEQGQSMSVSLGWEDDSLAVVFNGTIDEVRSNGSRDEGRELRISAKGVNTIAPPKWAQQRNFDGMTLKDVLTQVGMAAGVPDVKVDPKLAGITREYWWLNHESFLHFGERTAREVGGIFKVSGKTAIMAAKRGGSVSGQELGTIVAKWGDNLIRWDASPTRGRPRYKETESHYYDVKQAKWLKKTRDTDDTDAQTTKIDRYSRPDVTEAGGVTDNEADDSAREKGGGSVDIDGNAAAKPGGMCVIEGVRSGLGEYRINSVEHEYSRSSGWITRLEFKDPQSGGDDAADTSEGVDAGADDLPEDDQPGP